MTQITLDLDEETQALLEQAAKASGSSSSRWVTDLIRSKVRSQWPREFLDAAGSIPDFPLRNSDTESEAQDPTQRLSPKSHSSLYLRTLSP